MNSENLKGDYNRIEELMILECFMSKLDPDVQLFIADKGVKTASEAAVCADDYYLVRSQFKPKTTPQTKTDTDTSQQAKVTSGPSYANSVSQKPPTHTHTNTSPRSQRRVYSFCNKVGHTVDRCWRKAGIVRPNCFVDCQTPVATVVESQDNSKCSWATFPNQASEVPRGGNCNKDSVAWSNVSGEIVQAVTSDVTPGDLYAPHPSSGTVRLGGCRTQLASLGTPVHLLLYG
ncbi:hypothetical protein E2C01_090329 [Portunus trituberculatus]|uniref:Uncharacterized protein n=1 Tax=Portunus trituberculatus TaxID=210409 RepID=A0A5B7JGA2_PORTR|nr:hypothetical protein [Portunus trituberculatus]